MTEAAAVVLGVMGLQISGQIVSAVNVDQLLPAQHFFLPLTAAMIIFMITQNIILMGWPRPSPARRRRRNNLSRKQQQ